MPKDDAVGVRAASAVARAATCTAKLLLMWGSIRGPALGLRETGG